MAPIYKLDLGRLRLGLLALVAALVATVDIAGSALTTWKSTGRRIKSE